MVDDDDDDDDYDDHDDHDDHDHDDDHHDHDHDVVTRNITISPQKWYYCDYFTEHRRSK